MFIGKCKSLCHDGTEYQVHFLVQWMRRSNCCDSLDSVSSDGNCVDMDDFIYDDWNSVVAIDFNVVEILDVNVHFSTSKTSLVIIPKCRPSRCHRQMIFSRKILNSWNRFYVTLNGLLVVDKDDAYDSMYFLDTLNR